MLRDCTAPHLKPVYYGAVGRKHPEPVFFVSRPKPTFPISTFYSHGNKAFEAIEEIMNLSRTKGL